MNSSEWTGKPRSLEDLDVGSIYVFLYARPSFPGTFHWGLYIHADPVKGGHKIHITDMGSIRGTWITNHSMVAGISKELLLIGLMRIGRAGPMPLERVLKVVQEDDDSLNEVAGLTCRVYVERACDRLKAINVLSYSSWPVLEGEIKVWGSLHVDDCEMNYQPRPLVDSQICHLGNGKTDAACKDLEV